ncbi:hypothetical protein Hanom_Chr15g01407441 [Helianthus anomalus]
MPNVLILPQSADYSEVYMEIREKAATILQAFFLDDAPTNVVSDINEGESETLYEDEQSVKQDKRSLSQFVERHFRLLDLDLDSGSG